MAGKDKYKVEIIFEGIFELEIEAESYVAAADRFEAESESETQENLSEAIRLEIGKAEVNDRLELNCLMIQRIEAV